MNPYADPGFISYWQEQLALLEFVGGSVVDVLDASEKFEVIPQAVLFVNVQDFDALDAKLIGRVGLRRYARDKGWVFAKSIARYATDYETLTGERHPHHAFLAL